MTSGSLWNYYRDEIDDDDDDDDDDNASNGKSVEYKTKIVGKRSQRWLQPDPDAQGNPQPQPSVPPLNVEVTIPLKYLISNYWSFLDLPLTKDELELDLSWTKDCVLIQHHDNIKGVIVGITSAKLYIPVVTLSINDNIKFLENITRGFK